MCQSGMRGPHAVERGDSSLNNPLQVRGQSPDPALFGDMTTPELPYSLRAGVWFLLPMRRVR